MNTPNTDSGPGSVDDEMTENDLARPGLYQLSFCFHAVRK